jgi:hypothetical protein
MGKGKFLDYFDEMLKIMTNLPTLKMTKFSISQFTDLDLECISDCVANVMQSLRRLKRNLHYLLFCFISRYPITIVLKVISAMAGALGIPGMLGRFSSVRVSAAMTKADTVMVPIQPIHLPCQK